MINKNFHGLPFVTTKVDDVLVYSVTLQEYCNYLQQVFNKMQAGGLTLKGKKCKIAMSEVQYLVHVFSQARMKPDEQKINVFQDWPTPTTTNEVRS